MIQLDKDLFLILNGLHHPYLDEIMWQLSAKIIWIPLYLWLLYLLIKKYGKHTIIILLGVLLLIFLTDQGANLFKNYFQRLRPSHEPLLDGLVYTLKNYKGGMYGFYSSHAANAFGLSVYCYWLLKPLSKVVFTVLIFYAVAASYSRIYLGVHYPGDILAGALSGIFIATITAILVKKVINSTLAA